MISSVVANCAVVNPQNRGSSGAVIADAATIISRSVAINHATVESHCRRTSVVYAPTVAKRRVVIDRAITKGQRGMIIVHAATIENGLVVGVAIGDGQTGDGGGIRRRNVEHAAGGVAVHGQIGGPGTENGHAVGHQQFAAGQQDGAGDTRRVNGVPVGGAGQGRPQRAGSAVGGAGDGDRDLRHHSARRYQVEHGDQRGQERGHSCPQQLPNGSAVRICWRFFETHVAADRNVRAPPAVTDAV